MNCRLWKYLILFFACLHVSEQYVHSDGFLTGYFAVINQHEPTTQCMKNEFYDMESDKSFSVPCSDLIFWECAFNIFKSSMETFYVMGTKAPKDLATFATNAQTELNKQTLVPFGKWGKVSNQALEAYNQIMNAGLKDYLHELWAEACDYSLRFRPHSLACCVDQMIGVYLNKKKMWPPEQMEFIGGGCPRCGDQDFAANVDATFGKKIRVNFKDDSVPAYPTNTCVKNTNAQHGTGTDCWFHCCKDVVRYSLYLLSGATVNFKTCTSAEDTACHSGTNPSWHTKYFLVKTPDWTSMSCPSGPKYTEVDLGL